MNTPHQVIAIPLDKNQAKRLNLFIKAYSEIDGKGDNNQIRNMIFNFGLIEAENALFAILNTTDEEQEEEQDHA